MISGRNTTDTHAQDVMMNKFLLPIRKHSLIDIQGKLFEMFDVFSLRSVAEQPFTPTNSSPVFPRTSPDTTYLRDLLSVHPSRCH
jgi:hypothetical protein